MEMPHTNTEVAEDERKAEARILLATIFCDFLVRFNGEEKRESYRLAIPIHIVRHVPEARFFTARNPSYSHETHLLRISRPRQP